MKSYESLQIDKNQPIGFMDSGLGGLSVLKEAMKIMPYEDFIYFGDSKNAPYGTKSQEEIRELTFKVVEYLLDRGIKGLAVACNTATSAAVRILRQELPELPIVGIEPAVKPAVEKSQGGRVLVLATPMTIAQEKYQALINKYREQANIISIPCAGLMEFVEKGILKGRELESYFKEKIGPFIEKDTETMVLGCTHYPFLKEELNNYLKENFSNLDIELVDGSYGTSMELKRRLKVKGLLIDKERERKIIIENSLGQPLVDRSYMLLK